jgi:hypothetical protein
MAVTTPGIASTEQTDRQGAAHCTATGHGAHGAGASGNEPQLPAGYGQNDRMIALSRKNALFAGGDEGAENWAMLASLIETCKLHAVNPQAYLTDVLIKLVNNWPNSRLSRTDALGLGCRTLIGHEQNRPSSRSDRGHGIALTERRYAAKLICADRDVRCPTKRQQNLLNLSIA